MKKKVLIIVSVVASILLISGGIFAYFYFRPPTQTEIDQYEQILADGDLFFEARKYSQAVEKYSDAVKVIHTDKKAYSKIVDIYLLKNDFELALDIANKAQNSLSASDSSLIYASIANRYYEINDYYNARINYELAASLNSNPQVNLGLAKSSVQNADIDRAKDLLKKTYDDNTSDEATLLYAYIVGLEDTDKAVNILDDYDVVNTDWEGYFDEYMSVLTSLDEDTLFNAAKLARVYVNNGYPTLSISLLEPKLEDLQQYVDGLYLLGKAYLDSANYEDAISILSQTVSLIGYESQKYWMLGRAYYQTDDLVNTSVFYDRAIGYSGNDLNEDLVKEYLQILIDSNQTTKSQEVFSQIIDDIDENWLLLLGVDLYYKANNEAKVAYYLGKLSEKSLSDEELKQYLFWDIKNSLDRNEFENIDISFESLLELDRFNASYYWLKGEYDLKNSDIESAKSNFETALEYDLYGDVSTEVEKLLAQVE